MKRMGGGFGGKETRSVFISCAVALAAHHQRRPVRINIDRDVDMKTTGQRHAFIGKYRVGATADGRVVAADVQLYSNAGFSLDLSGAVMDRALFHLDNSYNFPVVNFRGRMVRSNLGSNTAFRGFGGPQGMMVCEVFMAHLASRLGIHEKMVREINLYQEGDRTHYGQLLPRNPLGRLWTGKERRGEGRRGGREEEKRRGEGRR